MSLPSATPSSQLFIFGSVGNVQWVPNGLIDSWTTRAVYFPAVADRRSASYISPAVADRRSASYIFPVVADRRSASYISPAVADRRSASYIPPAVADRYDAHAHMLIPPCCRSVRRACAHATGCAFGAAVVSEGCRRSVPYRGNHFADSAVPVPWWWH